ncbi:MAG: hypothetical protein EPO08_17780 [Rhodospirillaceae bacterium]|nr:MAG: hypothetical protein EPO08_17780 [Rhodospirillaceae bacterium]
MQDIPVHVRQALELRYDGPIPAQHLDTDRAERRRQRGIVSVLETQAAQFLDAAERCQSSMEDIAADLAERSLSQWQQEVSKRRLRITHERYDAHIRAAADALGQSIPLRRSLGLAPHPIVSLAALLDRVMK